MRSFLPRDCPGMKDRHGGLSLRKPHKPKRPYKTLYLSCNHSFAGLLKNPIEEKVTPAPPPGFGFWPLFRRKPESIFAPFAFSFLRSDVFNPERGGSESNTKKKGEFSEFRIRTPRNNKVVAALPGEKSKWIPAFAGMTNENFSANGKLPCRGRIHATHPVDTKPGPYICGPYKTIVPLPLERAFFNRP